MPPPHADLFDHGQMAFAPVFKRVDCVGCPQLTRQAKTRDPHPSRLTEHIVEEQSFGQEQNSSREYR